MCGIVAIFRDDGLPTKKHIIKRYQAQKHRGSQGYGYVSFDKNNILKEWFQGETEQDIMTTLQQELSPKIMFHHRFPTSTINVCEATHPIRVEHQDFKYSYFLVHNGVVTNAHTLKKDHESKGFVYGTELK